MQAVGHCQSSEASRVYNQPKSQPNLKISVVIPLFNGGRFIAQALDSVFAQQLPAAEVIVINDGSTDDGPEVVANHRNKNSIVLLHKPNGGQSSARNLGVEHAHADLIAFLDQDDVWYPDHLRVLIAPFLEARTVELGWSYSDLDAMNESGEIVTRSFLRTRATDHPKRDIASCLKHDMFVLPSASLVSRRVFRDVGGFDDRLSGYEDDDLFLRILLAGFDNVYFAKPLSKWRIYSSSSSYSPRMTISRAIYARKLIGKFSGYCEQSRYYVRDLIAYRFLRVMIWELGKATLNGTKQDQCIALSNLRFIIRHLPLQRRLPLELFFVPVFHIRPVAYFATHLGFILRKIFRRILKTPVAPQVSADVSPAILRQAHHDNLNQG